MNEFIITFRETLEATLIVGIIYVFLSQNKLTEAINRLWLGVISAIVISILIAVVVIKGSESLGNNSLKALFEAIFMFITAGFIWYVVFWLSKHVNDKKILESETRTAVASSWGVFFLIFFAILREGFETVIFLMGSFSMTKNFSYIGFFSGIILAVLIGYIIFIQGRKVDIKSFFKWTTLLLVFLASGMVAYGTHEVESYLVKSDNLKIVGLDSKDQISRPWDILHPKDELEAEDNSFFYTYNIKGKEKYTHLLHDSGRIGVFLKGFFGYNSNPNWVEIFMWVMSLFYGIRLWRRFYILKN